MAATYSSFMTTRFYSPDFNTAVFDGAFRIYFSQTYESAALKLYHLLQTEHQNLWNDVKRWSLQNKEHVFLLIYPDQKSVQSIFENPTVSSASQLQFMQEWYEGLAFGFVQPQTDEDLQQQLSFIEKNLTSWLRQQSLLVLKDVPSEI